MPASHVERFKRELAEMRQQQVTPAENPKKAMGAKKAPLHLLPPAPLTVMAQALYDGAIFNEYGPFNWRETPVEVMTYIGAIRRHLDLILDGQDTDTKSGVLHWGHVMACCAIILDAYFVGQLIDDRPRAGGAVSAQAAAAKWLADRNGR